jgi:hypothetical protein
VNSAPHSRPCAAMRRAFGTRAVAHLDAGMRPALCAGLYLATLAAAGSAGEAQHAAWRAALAGAAPVTEEALRTLAAALAAQASAARRQLLVDVSAWREAGATPDPLGARQLIELLERSANGMRVEPVWFDAAGATPGWRQARNAAGRLLGLQWMQQDEPVVDVYAGDIFYAPDAAAPAVQAAFDAGVFGAWRARGAGIQLLLRGVDGGALPRATACADRLVCASEAIAQQLAGQLQACGHGGGTR